MAEFLAKESNLPMIKSNTYQYKKERKEKTQRNKASTKMNTFIKKLEENGQNRQDITPIIHMAQAMATQSDYDSDSDTSDGSSTQSQHWLLQMEDKTPAGQIKTMKPPAEPPPSLEINPDKH